MLDKTTVLTNGDYFAEHWHQDIWHVYCKALEGQSEDSFIGYTADPIPYMAACVAGNWEEAQGYRYCEKGCDIPHNAAIDVRWERSDTGQLVTADYLIYDTSAFGVDDDETYLPAIRRGWVSILRKLRGNGLFDTKKEESHG